jgi:hypothetical protein
MSTVKIYTRTITKGQMISECGTFPSLSPWGDNTPYYEGYDDGGVDYQLPDGYEVAPNKYDEMMIWDDKGRHCSLVGDSRGKPMLVSSAKSVKLIEAVE